MIIRKTCLSVHQVAVAAEAGWTMARLTRLFVSITVLNISLISMLDTA